MMRRLLVWGSDARNQLLAEQDRWVYWVPVLIGGGIGIYFLLPVEPALWISLPGLAALAGVWFRLRRRQLLASLVLALVCVMAGLVAAQVRTRMVAAPMLDRNLGPVEVTGTVIARDVTAQGGRLLLTDLGIERLEPARTPARIRLTVRRSTGLPPAGTRVRVLANLLPPMEPSFPGGYDFRRDAFYDRIGAHAIALRPPEVTGTVTDVSLAERWREDLARHVATAIPGPEGAIAVALMTGERGAIDDQTNANMRAAGTSHLLSISGMHIGMVGGFVFFLVRALLALFPVLALDYPIKRWAALAALAAVVSYTWLVGAPIPAQRAALMAGLVFLAVLLDRQAITLRAVALAAGAILLVFPEALLNPGFQMSFAAILMLVSAYEGMQHHRTEGAQPSWMMRTVHYVAGIVVTSLIAGLATMPFGAWHFHRIQLLGVVGNLIAVPLTGFIVMPAVVLAYLLMPLGLGAPALWAMGEGLRGVTASAAWIAAWPYANLTVSQFSLSALLLMVLGGLWLGIWQGRIRWAGVAVITAGIALAVPAASSRPLVLVSPEGRVAIRGPDGALYVSRLPARGMTYEQWNLGFAGAGPIRAWTDPGAGVRCDALGCVVTGGVALPRLAAALPDDCRQARVVIAPDLRVRHCEASYVIDRQALRTHGAHMLLADGRIVTARSGSNRPWQPFVSYTSGSARPDAPVP